MERGFFCPTIRRAFKGLRLRHRMSRDFWVRTYMPAQHLFSLTPNFSWVLGHSREHLTPNFNWVLGHSREHFSSVLRHSREHLSSVLRHSREHFSSVLRHSREHLSLTPNFSWVLRHARDHQPFLTVS